MSGQQPNPRGPNMPRPQMAQYPRGVNPYGHMPPRGGSHPGMPYYYPQHFAPPSQGMDPNSAQSGMHSPYMYQGGYQGATGMYYPSYPQQPPTQHREPVKQRERKALPILNPNTNEVVVSSKQQTTPAAAPANPPDAVNAASVDVKSEDPKEAEAEAKAKADVAQLTLDIAKRKMLEEEKKEEDNRLEMEKKKKADELRVAAELEKQKAEDTKQQVEVSEEEPVQESEDMEAPYDDEDEETDPVPVPLERVQSSSGKITYSFESLMSIKENCKSVPESLRSVNFNIIAKRPGALARGGSGRGLAQGGSNRSGNSQSWPRGGYKPPRGPPGKVQGGLDVKPIVSTENAWKPKRDVSEEEASIKKIHGALNKLTMEKFERLSQQILDTKITSLKMLREVVKLIFEKALSEPNFGELYAQLCRVIVDHTADANHSWPFISVVSKGDSYYWTSVMDDEEDDATRLVGPFPTEQKAMEESKKQTAFKRLILNDCEEEFQKDNQIAEAEVKVNEIKILLEAETNQDKVTELNQQLQDVTYEAFKTKHRVLGNIQFIGELYKKGILNDKVMQSCINKLLVERSGNNGQSTDQKIPDEEELECLCKLLTTIGSTLDNSAAQSSNATSMATVNDYYSRLRVVADSRGLPVRHKFMILDVIELRENKWQARRHQVKMKKLDDIAKDAQREEQEKAKQAARGGNYRGPPPNRGGASGRNQTAPSRLGNVAQGNQMGNGGTRIGGTARRSTQPNSQSGRPAIGTTSNRPANTAFRPGGNGPAPKKASKTEKIDEEVMRRKVDNAFSEYVEMQLSDELKETFTEIADAVENRMDFQLYTVSSAISMIIEKKDGERRYIPQAILCLVNESDILDEIALVQGINQKLGYLGDDIIDNPKANIYVAAFLTEIIIGNGFALANLYRCMQSLAEATPSIMMQLLEQTLQNIAREASEIFEANKQDFKLAAFFNDDVDAAKKFAEAKHLEQFIA